MEASIFSLQMTAADATTWVEWRHELIWQVSSFRCERLIPAVPMNTFGAVRGFIVTYQSISIQGKDKLCNLAR